MTFKVFYHPNCQKHENGPGHVESPMRYESVENELQKSSGLTFIEAPMVTNETLESVHSKSHIRIVHESVEAGGTQLDPDTGTNLHSWEASGRAAGATVEAVKDVVAHGGRSFCLVRPPGHHALHDQVMGFCLFNNVALGAEAAINLGMKRIAIFDFDVHHGNGTEAIFYDRPDVHFSSVHQSPLYPGTGARDDRGNGAGKGTTLNIPLSAGSGDKELLNAWREEIRPAWEHFSPELVLLSAGFDGDARDPVGGLVYTPSGYETLSSEILAWTQEQNGIGIVSVLEGGYNCAALAEDVRIHIDVLKA